MASGAALQVAQPNINPVGYFQQSQQQAQQRQALALEQKKQGLQGIYMMSAGLLRGNLDGQADPAEWEQAIDMMAQQGADPALLESLRGRPEMANVMARGSAEALRYSMDERQLDAALKKLELEMKLAAAAGAKAPTIETFYDEDTGREVKRQWDGQGWVQVGGVKADDTQGSNKDAFGFEKDLWQQYANADPVKTYETVKEAYGRVVQSVEEQSGAGDLALIYAYMRMLDPGSVVRESEFAMAASAGDYGERIQGFVSQILNGQRLPESQRQEFLRSASELYAEQSSSLEAFNDQFQPRVEAWGVDPERVIRRPKQFDTQPPPQESSGDGGTFTTPNGIPWSF